MVFEILDLFSGLGAASLGLHRAGPFVTKAFCEINPDRRADLARNFPGVKIYDDIATLSAERLAADGIFPSVIAGGFPCQDISVAGPGGGIGTEDNPTARSGLWFEFARLIETVETAEWIIIENSPALRRRGLETILRKLHSCGFDAMWDGFTGYAIGADHERDRAYVIAYRDRHDGGQGRAWRPDTSHPGECQPIEALPLPPYSHGSRLAFWQSLRGNLGEELSTIERNHTGARARWEAEPGMVGALHAVPVTLDGPGKLRGPDLALWKSRIHGLGNSAFPDLFEAIGRAIVRVSS